MAFLLQSGEQFDHEPRHGEEPQCHRHEDRIHHHAAPPFIQCRCGAAAKANQYGVKTGRAEVKKVSRRLISPLKNSWHGHLGREV
jgi:hypothetical protein